MEIEKAQETGFCFGVKRAIDILENAVKTRGNIQTLGAVVHNEQVTSRLAGIGITPINDISEINDNAVAISSHGIPPELEKKLKEKKVEIIDTTCPFVLRAQAAARRLSEAGFFTVVFGDYSHPEVKGILGCTDGKGTAALSVDELQESLKNEKHIGILSQTTQIPENFTSFSSKMVQRMLDKDSEIRLIDTICHDIRKRQAVSLELSHRVDMMIVVGGSASANTRRLFELCSQITEAHHVETADQIDESWIKGKKRIGVTSGTSTPPEVIDDVVRYLENVNY